MPADMPPVSDHYVPSHVQTPPAIVAGVRVETQNNWMHQSLIPVTEIAPKRYVLQTLPTMPVAFDENIATQSAQDQVGPVASLYFDTGKATISQRDQGVLKSLPPGLYRVSGHADPRGKNDMNHALAQQRAATVAEAMPNLTEKFVESFGSRYATSTGKPAMHERDRRVDVYRLD